MIVAMQRRCNSVTLLLCCVWLIHTALATTEGTCPAGSSDCYVPDCRDEDDDNCHAWAAEGHCESEYKVHTKTTCRKSCPNVCNDGSFDLGESQEAMDQDTRYVIAQSLDYLKTEVYANDRYKESVRSQCKNWHAKCSFWASQGECTVNPTYMESKCALACRSCQNLDIGLRCPWDPTNTTLALQPGGLNAMFERITTDAEFQKYNPTILSQPSQDASKDGPWVVVLDDFLSPQECNALIQAGADMGYERSMGGAAERGENGEYLSEVSEHRTSYQAWCTDECYKTNVAKTVSKRISNLTGMADPHSEYLQLLKYEEGQYYRVHHDFIDAHVERPMGPRLITVFLYLNNVEEGGGTNFPLLGDLTVNPKRGRALVWPSVLDEDPMVKDDRTHHEALPVVKGQKFGSNAWLHLGDFKAAFDRNCHYN